MNIELSDLLNEVGTEADPTSFTHLTTFNTVKRWEIKSNKQIQLWQGYCNLLNDKPDIKLCLAERVPNETPVIVQLKFMFKIKNEKNLDIWRPYDTNFLAYLCHIYQTVLVETLETTIPDNLELLVAVLESPINYIETDKNQKRICIDIRLQFPLTKVDIGFQKRVIRTKVIKLFNDTKGLNKLSEKPIYDWEKIISDDFDSPIMLFGSSENPDKPTLKLTHTWHSIDQDMINDSESINEMEIYEACSPMNHSFVSKGFINNEVLEENLESNFWLPMILSLNYWDDLTTLKIEDDKRFHNNKESFSIIDTLNGLWGECDIEDKSIDICERMIPMLKNERFFLESSWLDIGKALHYSDNGREKSLLLWIKHTERVLEDNKMKPLDFMLARGNLKTSMTNIYSSFSNKQITDKTLAFYARIDSPVEYTEWHRGWSLPFIGKALNFSHVDVAIAVYRIYWLDYIYCPTLCKWVRFTMGKWLDDVGNHQLINSLTGDFITKIESVKGTLKDTISNSNNEDEISGCTTSILKLEALILKMKDVRYYRNIISALESRFVNYNFSKCCDSNPNILGLANGVFDVVGNNIHFRLAKPEDYVLLNTGCSYHTEFTWDSECVVQCENWMKKVFPDEQLRKHFLKFAASCIKGRNSDKIFPIFTGGGNNSKSMVVKLFMKTFGEYAIKFDMANVTGRNNNAGSASPHLARAKAVRLAFMDEAADDVPMHKETIKRIIGGDSFFTRKLHDNGGDMEVFFKLVLSCNKVPIIPKADTAIKNRVKIFPFESTWIEGVEDDFDKNIFKMDPMFEEEIPNLANGFIWIICQYYPYYVKDKLIDPPIVIQKTKEYWENNDVYAQFAADWIVIDKDRNSISSKVTFTEIYTKFRIWWKDSFDGVKVPEKPNVKNDLQSKWGNLIGKYWYGISLVEDDYGHEQKPIKAQTPIATDKNINKVIDMASRGAAKINEDIIPKEAVKMNIARDITDLANDAKLVMKKERCNDMQDCLGDIHTRLLSPGLVAMTSGERYIGNDYEDDGAVDI